jgi:hypothetical protein
VDCCLFASKGRIQWDNWVLLQAISDPAIVTFEASDVVLAVHLDHGASKVPLSFLSLRSLTSQCSRFLFDVVGCVIVLVWGR